MNVVRMCGTATDNIYLVLAPDEWELGMPEGLAHWNGAEWRWLKRLEKGYTVDMRFTEGNVILLDPDGPLFTWTANGEWLAQKAPYYSGPSPTRPFSPKFGYLSCIPFDPVSFAAVGYCGAFFLNKNGNWTRIATNTHEDLYYIYGVPPQSYICGTNGTILYFDGSNCRPIESGTSAFLLHIDGGFDGSLFVAGVGDGNPLIQILDDKIIGLHSAPSAIGWIAAISANEVYCMTDGHGVLVWDGQTFSPTRLSGIVTGLVTKLGRSVAVAPGPGSENVLFINPPHWKRIEITLDGGYVERLST